MNNKGFTLVEVIVTLLIIGVLGVICTMSVIGAINASKDKAEDQFLAELSREIDGYIASHSGEFVNYNVSNCDDNSVYCGEFTKEVSKVGSNVIENTAKYWRRQLTDASGQLISFTLDKLNTGKLVNPLNNKECKGPKGDGLDKVKVDVYMDSDFVYYYYVEVGELGLNCGISDGKSIDTRPANLKYAVDGEISNEEE